MRINFGAKNIKSVAKKELKSYFDSPTAYIVIVVFLLLWEFLFFRNAFLVGEASLRILFNFLPWLFLFLIPAITMGSVSEEKNEGTLEFLLTHPVKDKEFLAGKFIAALMFSALLLLFIFPVAAALSFFGNLDWGVVFGQYIASVFFASVLAALGIFISSLFKGQISSLLVSVAASFFLIIAGFEIVTESLPLSLAPLFERLSVLSHFESMSRGVVDLRDLWYFVSAVFIFLSLAYLQMLKRRFGNRKPLYRSYKIGISLFIGIAVLTNVVGSRIPGRIDLTQGRLYTLSDATKNTLSDLNDVVNITLFASSELPAQLQPALRDTKDILRDYKTLGKGNIVIETKNPSGNAETASMAKSLGIREMQFNVIGKEELKLKQGYLGLSVSYGGENKTVPFLKDTSDLEYQLTSFIKQLTATDKKKIGFLSGHGEKGISSGYRALSGELEKQFEVKTIDLDRKDSEKSVSVPDGTAVLVVAGPTEKIGDDARSAISKYLDNGGAGLFLIDGVSLNLQTLSVSQNQSSFSDFLKTYGVTVNNDLMYDLRSNKTVSFGGGGINFLIPYPFWARVVASGGNAITSKIEGITLPWASTLSLDDATLKDKNLSAVPLFKTTRFGGKQTGSFSVNPQRQPSQENLKEQLAAVGISGGGSAARLVVVGDSDFLSDQFVQNSPENMAFGMEALSWLSQEESLAGIKIKNNAERRLLFENNTQITLVKYGNMLFAFLLPVGFGIFRLTRRRNMRKFTYSKYS